MAYDPAERRARYQREKARQGNLFPERQWNPVSLVPSERIRGILELHYLTIDDFAEAMQLPRATAYSLCTGRAKVNAGHAVRLAAVLGGDPLDWMRLQCEHDLRQTKQKSREKLIGLATRFNSPDHWGE